MLSLKISCCDLRSHDEFEDLMLSLRISCCDCISHDELEDIMLWPKQSAPGIWGHQCQLDDNLEGQLINQTLHKVPILWDTVYVCSFLCLWFSARIRLGPIIASTQVLRVEPLLWLYINHQLNVNLEQLFWITFAPFSTQPHSLRYPQPHQIWTKMLKLQ